MGDFEARSKCKGHQLDGIYTESTSPSPTTLHLTGVHPSKELGSLYGTAESTQLEATSLVQVNFLKSLFASKGMGTHAICSSLRKTFASKC